MTIVDGATLWPALPGCPPEALVAGELRAEPTPAASATKPAASEPSSTGPLPHQPNHPPRWRAPFAARGPEPVDTPPVWLARDFYLGGGLTGTTAAAGVLIDYRTAARNDPLLTWANERVDVRTVTRWRLP